MLTRYPLSILNVKNDLSSQCGKSEKSNLTFTSKSHAHPHTMKKTYAKFHNNRYKTVRSCAHKTPRVNVDGKTDAGRTETCTPKSPMLKQVRQKVSLEYSLIHRT